MNERVSNRCVVVGLEDGGQPAGTLMAAADEAERRGVGLAIVTVLRHRLEPGLSIQGFRHDQQRAQATALQDLHAASASLHPSHPRLSVTTYCLGESEIAPDREPLSSGELLVIGTHASLGRQALALESAGCLLLQNSRGPILVVPDHLHPATEVRPGKPPMILVGVSEHPSDIAVVRAAYAGSVGRGCEVLLLHAYSRREGESGQQGRDRAQVLLDGFAAMAPAGTRVSVALIEDDPAAALFRLATEATLLVIGGRSGPAAALVRGSVSHAVLAAVPCPVLAVPRDLTAGPPAPLTGLTLVSVAKSEPV